MYTVGIFGIDSATGKRTKTTVLILDDYIVGVKEHTFFLLLYFKFATAVNLSIWMKLIKISYFTLHLHAPISELPSNISTMEQPGKDDFSLVIVSLQNNFLFPN